MNAPNPPIDKVLIDTQNQFEGIDLQGVGLTPQEKRRYTHEFTRYINIERFIGDYSFHFLIVGVIIAVIVIIVITTAIDDIQNFWFGVYAAITVCGIAALTLIGFSIKKRSRKVKLEQLVDYIFYRLISWTNVKLREAKTINDKRILVENLMSIYYDYTKFKEVNLWDRNNNLIELYKLIDNSKSHESINFSLKLFDMFYLNPDQSYNEKGVLVVVKIFLPLLNVSTDPHVCNTILKFIKKFMKDTKMNVFKSRVLNKTSLVRQEEVVVTKRIFSQKHNFLDLFETLWEGSIIKSQEFDRQRTPINRNDADDEHIENLRAILHGQRNNRRGETLLETDNRLKSFVFLKNSPGMLGKDIITHNYPFGIHSQLLAELKQKCLEESNNEQCELLAPQLGLDQKKSIEQMRHYLEESGRKVEPVVNFEVNGNGFMNKEAPEQFYDNYATCESQKGNIVKSIGLNKDEEDYEDINRPLTLVTPGRLNSKLKTQNLESKNIANNKMQSLIFENEDNKDIEDDDIKNNSIKEPIIRLSLREIDNNRASFSIDKPTNKSFISINHIEIPVILKDDVVELSADINKFLSIAKDDTSNFKTVINKDNIAIYQRHSENSPVVLVRCDTVVRGNINTVFEAIFNLEKRSQWDSVFSRLKILKVFDEHTDVMYTFLKAPPLVTNRDFLQKRCYKRNIGGFDIVLAFVSYEDKDFPPIKSAIRANTIISGYAFKKIDESTTKLVIISQTDIKGSIPTWIINMTASKAPSDWVKRLEKAVKKFEADN